MIRADEERIEIAGEVKAESDQGYKFYDGDVTVWLPRSQCVWDGKTMEMPEWLAISRGLA